MNRRKFILASLLAPFAAFAARFAPKPVTHRYPTGMWNADGGDLGHDCARMRCELNGTEYREYLRARYGVPGQAPIPPRVIGYVYQVSWITKEGYITAPSPASGRLFAAE